MSLPLHIAAVSALVTRPDGKVLLMQHPRRGWEFPGGQVEEGETLLEALAREVREETGVDIVPGQLVGVYTNVRPPCKLIFAFLAGYLSGELSPSSESPYVEWVARCHALEHVTHPAIYDRMEDMLNFAGRIIYRVYTLEPYSILSESWIS